MARYPYNLETYDKLIARDQSGPAAPSTLVSRIATLRLAIRGMESIGYSGPGLDAKRAQLEMLEEEQKAQQIAGPLLVELLANAKALDVAYGLMSTRREMFVSQIRDINSGAS